MISRLVYRLSRAVLGGFLIGSSLIGYAQESNTPGLVRITDARPQGVPIRNVSRGEYYFNGHFGEKLPGQYHPVPGGYADACQHCNGGGCPYCSGDCYGGHCKHGHCLHGKFQEHYCSFSPDHGFSVPAKNPIWRRGVQYNQYYPSGWYGTANGGIAPGMVYPTIYQPTDTTQLGFYYQHVPFWMPKPNALPPRPIPAQWHVYAPAYHGSPYGWGNGYCPQGASWVDGSMTTVTPTPLPAQSQPTPSTIEEPPQPIPEQVPAPAPDASARNLEIRRANFEE